MSRAILAGASAQLRNMATNGGNLLQRTRCYYFYDTATPCNKRDPGAGCPAIDGFNRMHAILGTSDQCIAVHPSDMCVALAALDAVVKVTGERGDRAIPFAEFHRLPADTPHHRHDPGGRRDHHVDRSPGEGIRRSLRLPEDPRSCLVRIRAGVGGGCARDGRRHDHRGAHRARRRGAQTMAQHGRGSHAEPVCARRKTTSRRSATPSCATPGASATTTFKIGLAQRAIVRALQHASHMGRTP